MDVDEALGIHRSHPRDAPRPARGSPWSLRQRPDPAHRRHINDADQVPPTLSPCRRRPAATPDRRSAHRRPPARRHSRRASVAGKGDEGMTTAEYAVGTVAACGFAGVLWTVLHSSIVRQMLGSVIHRALTIAF
ncbi:MAG TPA: DUF4244 domain-containing protein [Frankiaceae bacterium]|nr:DUF4244 domain-containing protein [Frankiaceae bacterium]